MRAIDLYAGVGGWALGLRMAGLAVSDSYEWWAPAITTHEKNHHKKVHACDIRQLGLDDLPSKVDIVVGSPPCTQFSFSNRGGKGDIEDGLVDVEKFLEVVAFLRPRFWAMENVPRVKEILETQLEKGRRLERFAELDMKSMIIDMSEFGLPQKRRRCIAGNFDFELLLSYRERINSRTLGNILETLSAPRVVDPIYGEPIARPSLTDHNPESPLNVEEERMNRESKMFHPVYNNMAFPDPESSPVRTITATCTRVSRESVVVRAPEDRSTLRRLTVRERASLQGFPLSYRFFGSTYAQKLKMVGNAIPPLMTFYIAQAMKSIKPDSLYTPAEGIQKFKPSNEAPPITEPDSEGRVYPDNRTFRAAIPNLRFKSGVRFEIANEFLSSGQASWRARFYFGNSRDIRECALNEALLVDCEQNVMDEISWRNVTRAIKPLTSLARSADAQKLQSVWTHRTKGLHPFEIVDAAGTTAEKVIQTVAKLELGSVESFVVKTLGLGIRIGNDGQTKNGGPSAKVRRFAPAILAGFIVGAALNQALATGRSGRRAELFKYRVVA